MRFSVACDSVFLDIREKSDYSQIFVGLAISSREKRILAKREGNEPMLSRVSGDI
jgi:hypothetical protein